MQFGVCVKRGLVLPQFEQDQLVGIEDALEHLELFAAGILPRDLAARAFIACASSAPLPGAAWNVTTSRTAMASPPMPNLDQPVS